MDHDINGVKSVLYKITNKTTGSMFYDIIYVIENCIHKSLQ